MIKYSILFILISSIFVSCIYDNNYCLIIGKIDDGKEFSLISNNVYYKLMDEVIVHDKNKLIKIDSMPSETGEVFPDYELVENNVKLSLVEYDDQDNKRIMVIFGINTKTSQVYTNKKISIGSSIEDIIKMYGYTNPKLNNKSIILEYYYKSDQPFGSLDSYPILRFTCNNGRVSDILVYNALIY